LYFIIIASISNPDFVIAGDVTLYPKEITFSGYQKIFKFDNLLNGYKNSFFYAIVGGFISATLTLFAAYPLSKNDFSGRKPFTIFLLITMFFSGGMIPLYIVVNNLKLRNTPYVLLIVGGIQVWNLLVTRSYFKSSHIESLNEAAEIDGCSHFGYFFKILLPISKPIVITMLLFYAVWQWNDFFRAMIYLDKPTYQPLQIVLRDLLATSQVSSAVYDQMEDQSQLTEMLRAAEQMKYGVIVMATLPMMVVYLVMQEYFVQGITMGSVKG
jgi:putative aldouronate transport system permease protein